MNVAGPSVKLRPLMIPGSIWVFGVCRRIDALAGQRSISAAAERHVVLRKAGSLLKQMADEQNCVKAPEWQ